MRKSITLVLIALFLVSVLVFLNGPKLEQDMRLVKGRDTTEMIRIDSSSDFKKQADHDGWKGKGTVEEPIVIEDLKIDGSSSGCCIYIGNTSLHYIIRDCQLKNADNNDGFYHWNSGVVIYNSRNGRIENITSANHAGAGIYLSESEDMVISNSTIQHNRHGLFLNRANSNHLSRNTVCGNTKSGLYFYHSYFNIFENSSVSLTGEDGVYCLHSNDNNFVYNRFSNNNCSIHLYQSNNNFIHHNNFFYNMRILDYCDNNWDDGYPSGGNYWSFLRSLDERSGVDQTKEGSDGIIDESYDVPVRESKDRYPLKEPVNIDLDFEVTRPGVPREISVKEEEKRIELRWKLPYSDGGSPIHTYNIYRSQDEDVKFFKEVYGNSTRFVDNNVEPGQEYYYMITSVNEKGESEGSEIVKVVIEKDSFTSGYTIPLFAVVLFLLTYLVYKKQ